VSEADVIKRYFDLSGKVAVVTGGSRGLGLEMARAFAWAGADVVIASRKMPDLDLWHTERLKSEFQADKASADTTFEEYLQVESRLFKEVRRKVVERVPKTAGYRLYRYFPNGLNNPLSFEHNWNRSYELIRIRSNRKVPKVPKV